jgi:DNA-directed RNA polymerase specialized sigma24 family protein
MNDTATPGNEVLDTSLLTGPTLDPKVKVLEGRDFEKTFHELCLMIGFTPEKLKKGEGALRDEMRPVLESKHLSREQTAAIQAVFIEGKTIAQSSTEAKLPPATVYFQLTSGCAKIKKDALLKHCQRLPVSKPVPIPPPLVRAAHRETHHLPQRSPKPVEKRAAKTTSLPSKPRDEVSARRDLCLRMGLSEEIFLKGEDEFQQEFSALFAKAGITSSNTLILHLLLEGKSPTQIADRCGISPLTVTVVLNRSMNEVRACLGKPIDPSMLFT